LRETFKAAVQDRLNLDDNLRVNVHRNHGAFAEVDNQAGGRGKLIQDPFQTARSSSTSPEDNQRIIGVLQNRAGGFAIDQGVLERSFKLDHALKEIAHQEVQVGRQGVPLAQPSLQINPTARDPVEENSGLG
jgi:hypothetical protein